MTLSASRLKEMLEYFPETGEFRWRKRPRGVTVGKRAGNLNVALGYRQLRLDGKLYYEHRLAWFYAYGEWPAQTIDHKNGKRDDNRLSNLREATFRQNNISRQRRKDNTSGHRGVTWHSVNKKWMAMIAKNGKQTYIGTYDRKEDACAAYRRAAREAFGEFYWDD